MEKTKVKKRWGWKTKFIRRAIKRNCYWSHPPKSFRKPYWGTHRAMEKAGIYKCLNGFEDYSFPYHHKHSASWDYN